MSIAEVIYGLLKDFPVGVQMGIVIGTLTILTLFLIILLLSIVLPKDIKWGKFQVKSLRPEATKRKKKMKKK